MIKVVVSEKKIKGDLKHIVSFEDEEHTFDRHVEAKLFLDELRVSNELSITYNALK